MSNARHRTTTYRGGTLEEVLPRIRSELGPDAVIVRQREGVIGGVGGFFGKKCVEIEARPAAVRQAQPARSVVDAYDTGEPRPDAKSALLQTLMDQSSPFAAELSDALSQPSADETIAEAPAPVVEEAAAGEDAPVAEPAAAPAESRVAAPTRARANAPAVARANAPTIVRASMPADIPAAAPIEARVTIARRAPEAPAVDEPAVARANLLAAGFGAGLAEDIVAEATRTLLPFAPGVPFEVLANRVLTRRISVSAGSEKKRRIIALIGAAESGRTLTTAKLCHTYAAAGRKVMAVSVEHARNALELARLIDADDIEFEIASRPESISRPHLRKSEVVVVDTPPLDPRNPRSFTSSARLLEKLRANETHVVMPADVDFESGRALLEQLSGPLTPSQILVTGADRGGETCMPVVLSLAFGLPISFVTDSPLPTSGLHPAEPEELARMALA
jgi:flagellar biosynthesis protein FlhF